MGIPAHIRRLRAAVGHDLLSLPSVSVLPVDHAGRLLLVRHAGHRDGLEPSRFARALLSATGYL